LKVLKNSVKNKNVKPDCFGKFLTSMTKILLRVSRRISRSESLDQREAPPRGRCWIYP